MVLDDNIQWLVFIMVQKETLTTLCYSHLFNHETERCWKLCLLSFLQLEYLHELAYIQFNKETHN